MVYVKKNYYDSRSKKVINKLYMFGPKIIKEMKNKFDKEQWSKKLYTSGDLDDLKNISISESHFNKSELITGFSITDYEKDNLIDFLKSLTDNNFTNNTFFEE